MEVHWSHRDCQLQPFALRARGPSCGKYKDFSGVGIVEMRYVFLARYVRSWVAWQLAVFCCDAGAALTMRPAGPTGLAYRIEGAAARFRESSTYQWNPRRSMQTDPMVNMLSVELPRTNQRSQISTHCSRVTHPPPRPRGIDESEQPATTKRIVGTCSA